LITDNNVHEAVKGNDGGAVCIKYVARFYGYVSSLKPTGNEKMNSTESIWVSL